MAVYRIAGLLFLFAGHAFAQLPAANAPTENPTTSQKALLGKILFWEEQLSVDDSMACGTCHRPEHGGADPRAAHQPHPGPDLVYGTADDRHGSQGITRQNQSGSFVYDELFGPEKPVSSRMAPSALVAPHHQRLLWDGQTGPVFHDPETQTVAISNNGTLEGQVLHPLMIAGEMGKEGRTWNEVRYKLSTRRPLAIARNLTPDINAALNANPTYPLLFASVYGDTAITARRIAFALASYLRTLTPNQTAWDRYQNGETNALTPNQILGMQVFMGSGHCSECHPAPLFSDDNFHNLGIDPNSGDLGRYEATGQAEDRGAFKTPSLRNAGLRSRLYHNGASSSLLNTTEQLTDPRSVYNTYMNGGGTDTNVDPVLRPIASQGVTQPEMLAVLDFVGNALTDPRAEQGLYPFDHPTLRTSVATPITSFGATLEGSQKPQIIGTPAYLGNNEWKIGLVGGDGNTIAYLGWSLERRQETHFSSGIPINIGPDVIGLFRVLNNRANTNEISTVAVPLPNEPMLKNLAIYMQMWVTDSTTACQCGASEGYRVELDF